MYKILILCPLLKNKGGVANYYELLKKYFCSTNIKIDYYFTGKRKENPKLFERIVYSIKDLFYLSARFYKYDLIHLNPSLDPKALIRDGIYHFVAKRIFRKKTLVFFRGWQPVFERLITKRFRKIFRLFFDFDCAIVLANSFKKKLVSWGYEAARIEVETTAVDDELLNGFSIDKRIRKIGTSDKMELLFLARIEKEKGISETIHAVCILLEKFPNIHLVVAGDGPFMDEAQKVGNNILREKVSFLGYIKGDQKKKVFQNSDIYIFPSYREGMPTSVLEAMAFGLPVVTRPVGGLKNIFLDGEHGFMSESKDPEVIASFVEKIITDKELWKKMSANAHKYAKERFMASNVVKRLENIYIKTISGRICSNNR